MTQDPTVRRRWVGAISLLAALAMLVAGETFLKARLGGFGFLVYWLVCFSLTGVAMLIAVRDARAQLRQTRQEHHRLLETAIQEIRTDAKTKPRQEKR